MRLAAIALLLPLTLLAAPVGKGLEGMRVGGVDYVSLSEGAVRLGLRTERVASPPSIILKDGAKPVARLADHSRETDIKGLRVFFGDAVIESRGTYYLSRTDFEAHLAPRLRPDLCMPIPRVPRVVAIDAGHGGVDHGTENPALGTMEKTYTLDVALRLKKLLEADGYRVVMTRESDVTVAHEQRSEIANLAGADLFVSVHFNSLYPNTKTTGVEILSYPPRAQRSTESWSPGKKDDARNIEEPINAFDAWNTVLGSILHRRLLESLRSPDRGEKLEHLKALAGLRCPAVLVEPAFLSSGVEGVQLATSAYRDRIAAAVAAGIVDYTEELARLQPASVAAPVAPSPSAAPAHLQPTRPSPSS